MAAEPALVEKLTMAVTVARALNCGPNVGAVCSWVRSPSLVTNEPGVSLPRLDYNQKRFGPIF